MTARIEFAPGHEDEAITEQDVAARMLKMKAAEQMYEALRNLTIAVENIGGEHVTGREGLEQRMAEVYAAIDAAEGRSHQEQS